eukprot:TRINITY_DN5405_c0_g1_i5.p1 TRINITY_DN5405_c0_g1~~TRINITY_DN5405_c0_g1_i5.p1  ORF type:complete len:352 (-),score=11.84 TRINITY_DN5405_c0_g1_i5:69-1124(-)
MAAVPPPAPERKEVMQDHDPLIKACKKGDHKAVLSILKGTALAEQNAYINMGDRNGSTPIYHTVWPGHGECLRILLENGADPNIQNNRGNSALHLACEKGHKHIIKLLINHGANIELQNWDNRVCYECAGPDIRNDIEAFVKQTAIEYQEAMESAFHSKITPQQRIEFKQCFDTIDVDEDGYLSVSEMQTMMLMITEGPGSIAEFKEFYGYLDQDKDGQISFQDFLRGAVAILETEDPNTAQESKKKEKKEKKNQNREEPRTPSRSEVPRSLSRSQSRNGQGNLSVPATPSTPNMGMTHEDNGFDAGEDGERDGEFEMRSTTPNPNGSRTTSPLPRAVSRSSVTSRNSDRP